MIPSNTPASDARAKASTDLRPVVAALQDTLGASLIALVLFGSRARGDHRPDSDWDILMVACDLPDKIFARHLFLKRALPDQWRGQVAIFAKTSNEFEGHIPPLYLDIALDGVLLYDRDGYMGHKLDTLRLLIQQNRLYREQRGHELIWHAEPPSGDRQLNWNHAS